MTTEGKTALNREALRKEAEVNVALAAEITAIGVGLDSLASSNLGWALTVLSLLAELERVEAERAGLWCCTFEDKAAMDAANAALWRRVEAAEAK